MAEVFLDHLTKTFQGPGRKTVAAVQDLSLRVQDKELIVLAGPSGCGKTTTLRLIAGFETPGTGAISLGERIVNNVAPKDRDVAMVFQIYALYPHMTVYENIAFGLKARRLPRLEIQQRV